MKNSQGVNDNQSIDRGAERLENKRMIGDNPNYSFIKIGQNTEKSPGDLRKLAVTQTPVRKHPLTLVFKTLKSVLIIIMITKKIANVGYVMIETK